MKIKSIYTLLLTTAFFLSSAVAQDIKLNSIELPEGFSVNLYAKLKNPRQMALGEDGTVYVGSVFSGDGQIYAVLNPERNDAASEVVVIDKELSLPSGLTYKDGDLYVGAVNIILRYNDIANNLKSGKNPEVITDALPSDPMHSWKFIDFGPDGLLYFPVGSPCNNCIPEKDIYASILRLDVNDAKNSLEHFAHGVRLSVGFDWDTTTGGLWFTDNGADGFGVDLPHEELNYAPKEGMHFGFPYFHQGDITDAENAKGKVVNDYTPPAQKLEPHAAALGMTFYKGDMFPVKFKDQIIIAEHGSTTANSQGILPGHKLSLVTIENGKTTSYEPFMTGWVVGGVPWGRPADILELDDGSLLVADDKANAIYRISYAE